MLRALKISTTLLLVLAARRAVCAQDAKNAQAPPPATQTFALTDTKDLNLLGMKADVAEYRGRTAVRLTRDGGDSGGMAMVKGTSFRDGTIEVDMATHITLPPGVRMPGFTGIAFRAREDSSRYELFYMRPKNALADDQAMRNHSVQYTSEPNYGWEKLRRQWPAIYESYAELRPDEWTKMKIEVHGRRAKLFLNGSANPSLVIDGMKGEDLQGAIALWGYTGQETYFSNLRITNDKPEPIENGGEAAGTWDVTFATDAGMLTGKLKLLRDGSTLAGLWAGSLGPDQAVNGIWRDGYVELSFSGTWPDQPGAVTATLAGWVDGDAAGGRVKVEGRADGRWMAKRQK